MPRCRGVRAAEGKGSKHQHPEQEPLGISLSRATSSLTGCDSKDSFGHSQVRFYSECVTRIISNNEPLPANEFPARRIPNPEFPIWPSGSRIVRFSRRG